MKRLVTVVLAAYMSISLMAEGVAVATWTGLGSENDLSDRDNWTCVDSDGTVVENGLPDSDSKIVLTGAIGVDFPLGMSLAFASVAIDGTVVLTRDCDWQGLGNISFRLNSKIDLAGHRLELPTFQQGELQPIEYIESTGSQIINTGVVPGANTSLDIDFGTTDYQSEATLFATMNWNQHQYMLTLRNDKGPNQFCWFGDYQFADFHPNRRMRLTVDSVNGALTFFDGETAEQLAQIVSSDFTCGCGKPLSIFGQNDGTKAGKYRIYSFKIIQGGSLVRDFVPVRVKRSKLCGLYDKVQGQLYSAAGLLKGADVAGESYGSVTETVKLEVEDSESAVEGYAAVAYIESTGGQVIKTGIVPGTTTSLDIDFTTFNYVQEATLFATQGWEQRMYMFTLQIDKFRWFGNAETFTFYSNRHLRMNFNCEDKRIYVYDGDSGAVLETVTVGDNSFTNGSNKELSLFGQNDGTKAGRYRIHALKITKDGQLVRDYVPMVRLSDMQPGLYDRVGRVFHTAAGLKSSVLPPEITDSTAGNSDFRPTAWIQSTGAQVINTDIVPGADTSLDIDFETFTFSNESTLFATMNWNQHQYMLTLRNDKKVDQFCWFGDYQFADFHPNRRMRLTVDSVNGALTFFDGETAEQLAQIATMDFRCDCGKPLSIFGQNDGTKAGKYRIYSFKITKGGTLVRDFVPGYSVLEKRYGLFDRVSGTFFGANGLLSGPVKEADLAATACGTLAFDSAAGNQYKQTQIAFTGNLGVEKNGAGALELSAVNSYVGPTLVNAGTLSAAQGVTTPFGAIGNNVLIGEGASFDLKGRGGFQDYCFVLDGGRIANTGASIANAQPALGSIVLTKAASFDVAADWGLVGASQNDTQIDLKGNELTVTLGNSAKFYLFNTKALNGKMVFNGQGVVWVGGTKDFKGEDVDVVHNCDGLSLAFDLRVRDFTDNSQNASGTGDGVVRVAGRYVASTDAYRDCVLGTGAVVDLTSRTTELSTGSAATGKVGQGLAFEDGASITFDIGNRKISQDMRLLAWESEPANLEDLDFAVVSSRPLTKYYAIVSKGDNGGVYLTSYSTIILIR